MRRNSQSASGKQIAVFLDRDGVINEDPHLLHRKEQLVLIPGAAEAIGRLNVSNVKAVVVTNQAVVARGLCTETDLDEIHAILQQMLRDRGARLDAIYYCPHHENADMPNYRIKCECRKPGVGMLNRAAREFDLQLSDCFLVGDRTSDIQTGKNAGCLSVLVSTGCAGQDGEYKTEPDFSCHDLGDAVFWILNQIKVRQGEQ